MFVKKKKKENTENDINSWWRTAISSWRIKIQDSEANAWRRKSEAKVEVGNGKSEVGGRKTLLRFEWDFISGSYLKDLKYKAKI